MNSRRRCSCVNDDTPAVYAHDKRPLQTVAFTPTTATTTPTTATTTPTTATTTTVLRPLYRTTCVNWHHQLRTAGFCWSSFTAHMPSLMATSAFG